MSPQPPNLSTPPCAPGANDTAGTSDVPEGPDGCPRDPGLQQLVPSPVLDERELASIDALTERYHALNEPGPVARGVAIAGLFVPNEVKDAWSRGRQRLSRATDAHRDLYMQAIEVVGRGFDHLERQAAELSCSTSFILTRVNETSGRHLHHLEEICLLRSYEIASALEPYKRADRQIAFLEGCLTGLPGIAGIPANIALATLLGFRATQSVASFYGYDVKRDPAELALAGEVFIHSMEHHAPAGEGDEGARFEAATSPVERVLLISKGVAVKIGVKSGWKELAMRGGVAALMTEMRSIALRAAEEQMVLTAEKHAIRTAEEQAARVGAREIEQMVVRDALQQASKDATQKFVQRSIPLVSGAIGGYFDAKKVARALEVADIFYQKRFILEKETRIQNLLARS